MTATCPDQAELSDLVLGKMDEPELTEVAKHIESCADCQTTIGFLEENDDTFVEAIRERALADEMADESQFPVALVRIKAMGRELAPDDKSRGEQSPGRLREYELQAKLGEGGMGTVYKALHTRMRRVVALKVLATHRRHDPAVVERFAREVEAVGTLSHPNIVTAHDAGEEDGMHFLVMELVEGVDLHTLVAQHGPLPVADACEIVRQAALGLQHAHEHGLVHRDLKPSNLMLAVSDQKSAVSSDAAIGGRCLMANGGRQAPGKSAHAPDLSNQPADAGRSPIAQVTNQPADAGRSPVAQVKILDLGLALLQGEPTHEREEITATGQVMGTLDYMAPEQADDSHGVDIRADIYALGCTFYKLLTGRAPFSGESYNSIAKKLRGHAENAPPPVREIRPEVPEPLSELMGRMLAKSPDDRPATPADVAAALDPFCDNCDLPELIAQIDVPSQRDLDPASQAEIAMMLPMSKRSKKDRDRRRIGIFAGIASLLLFAVAAAAIVISIRRGDGPATTVKVPEGSEVDVDEDGRVNVTLPADRPAELTLPDSPQRWPMSSRVDLYGDPLPLGAVARMGTVRFRHPDVIRSLHYSPDGKTLTSFSSPTRQSQNPGVVRCWNMETGKVKGEFVFEPYQPPEGQTFAHPTLFDVSISADGSQLALCGKDIRIWDARERVERLKLDCWGRAVLAPNGAVLAVFDHGGDEITLVDATSGKKRFTIAVDQHHEGCRMAFSPDSRLLAIGNAWRLQVWDWAAGRRLHDFDVDGLVFRFSPDGNRLAASHIKIDGDKAPMDSIRLWDIQTGEELSTLEREALHYALTDFAFSPDGQMVATVGRHGQGSSIDLWDVETGKQRRSMKTDWGLTCAAFSPDGSTLAVAGSRKIVQFWNVAGGTQRVSTQPDCGGIRAMAISPDDHTVATIASDRTIRLWDAGNGGIRRSFRSNDEPGYITGLAFASDGQRLASAGQQVRSWNLATGHARTLHRQVHLHGGTEKCLAFHGQHLFAVCRHTLFQWDSVTGKELTSWDRQEDELPRIPADGLDRANADLIRRRLRLRLLGTAISPDVRLIASAIGPDSDPFARVPDSPGRKILLWDVQTKAKPDTIDVGPSCHGRSLSFSPDGHLLTWSGADSMVIYDTRRRCRLLTLGPQQLTGIQPGNAPIAFSPDGRIAAMAVPGAKLVLWEIASGQRLLELQGHHDGITSLAFNSNGRRLVSAAMDGMALVWDLPTAVRELHPVDEAPAGGLDSLWDGLAAQDAAAAFRAMWLLVQTGPAAAELIMGKLADAKPTGEDTNRPLTSDRQLQRLRAVQVLELLGTPDAVSALEQLAKGPEAAVHVQEAQAAMNRFADAERRVHVTADQKDERVSRELQSPTTMEFIETPLADMVDYMADLHSTEFQIAEGVKRDTPITTNLKKTSLADALKKMLAPHKLTFRVVDGRILIESAGTKPEPASETPDGIRVEIDPMGEAEEKIEEALRSPTTMKFTDTPLKDVVDYLKNLHKIEIQIDRRAFEDFGLNADTPITRNVKGVSLRSALNLMLSEKGLTHLVTNEVLVITTPKEAPKLLYSRVYPVGDLLAAAGAPGPAEKDCEALGELIRTVVFPESWTTVGGAGVLVPVPPVAPKALIVDQHREAHEAVARLLAMLRDSTRAEPGEPAPPIVFPGAAEKKIDEALRAPTEIEFVETPLQDAVDFLKDLHGIEIQVDVRALREAGMSPKAPITRNLKGVSLRSALRLMLHDLDRDLTSLVRDEVLLITTPAEAGRWIYAQVYPVGDLIAPPEGGGSPDRACAALVEVIQAEACPMDWDEAGGCGVVKAFPTSWPKVLVVRQHRQGHAEVAGLLSLLRAGTRLQPGSGPLPVGRKPAAEKKIAEALDSTTALEFSDAPLTDVVKHLKRLHKIEIQIDRKTLDNIGVGSDTPITRNLREVTLRNALRLILQQLDLTYTIWDEVLLITTREVAGEELVLKLYPLQGLIPADLKTPAARKEYAEKLVATIQDVIDPKTWDRGGGPGSITAVCIPTLDALLVTQTVDIHQAVARLLAQPEMRP